jgi:tetratricopeptide (TPR) repeat protein
MLLILWSVGPAISGSPGLDGSGPGRKVVGKSLLIDYYQSLQRDRDLESFRQKVSARYDQNVLGRLMHDNDVEARRAAVIALGLVGDKQMNLSVAGALKDADPQVRYLAENALWSIWFHADTAENNRTLEDVAELIGRRRFQEAISLATKLIERSPGFAEAYNQRAIAEFFLERYAESADDCKRVLERNSVHIGALSGLAKCQLELNLHAEAVQSLERASRLQPYNESLRQMIAAINGLER